MERPSIKGSLGGKCPGWMQTCQWNNLNMIRIYFGNQYFINKEVAMHISCNWTYEEKLLINLLMIKICAFKSSDIHQTTNVSTKRRYYGCCGFTTRQCFDIQVCGMCFLWQPHFSVRSFTVPCEQLELKRYRSLFIVAFAWHSWKKCTIRDSRIGMCPHWAREWSIANVAPIWRYIHEWNMWSMCLGTHVAWKELQLRKQTTKVQSHMVSLLAIEWTSYLSSFVLVRMVRYTCRQRSS